MVSRGTARVGKEHEQTSLHRAGGAPSIQNRKLSAWVEVKRCMGGEQAEEKGKEECDPKDKGKSLTEYKHERWGGWNSHPLFLYVEFCTPKYRRD